jgi:YHS domain-containing protein
MGVSYPRRVQRLSDGLAAGDGEEADDMKDPVCGMTVQIEHAAAAWEYDGRAYYFCSVGCMERFRRDPEHFLALDDADRSMG